MIRRLIALLWLALAPAALAAEPAPPLEPRTVLALYDGLEEDDPRFTPLHRFIDMPLGHLGLRLRYRDIATSLPDPAELEGIRGVVTWFVGDSMPDPMGFIGWVEAVTARGIPVVVIGQTGIGADMAGRATPQADQERFFRALGFDYDGDSTYLSYGVKVLRKDPALVEFERPLPPVLPPFLHLRPLPGAEAGSFLVVGRPDNPESESHVVALTTRGGYVATGFTHYFNERLQQLQWYLNPFDFFRRAFRTDALPKPDTTTLSGRRIYYSHVDGDGWNNVSEIRDPDNREERLTAPEVIERFAVAPYPDLPVTMGIVAAEVHADWQGTERGRKAARALLAHPQVEAGSHSFSHPFEWSFFAEYSIEKELPYLERTGAAERFKQRYLAKLGLTGRPVGTAEGTDSGRYDVPRAYLDYPFDMEQEITGAVAVIEALAPPGKKVELFQWSGDTRPYPAFLKRLREVGLPNINGGDTRLDSEYPSTAWVAPLARQVAGELQVYASNSNENTYTDLWHDRFFGFRGLVETLRNTELPRRLKPVNVYYHTYSGEKRASLKALTDNLDWARGQSLAPIPASRFARIVEGFFTTELEALGPRRWRVAQRGALNTLRFDGAEALAVDPAGSEGVLGWNRHAGSLYVALDPAAPAPVVALGPAAGGPCVAGVPSLIEARWPVRGLESMAGGFAFEAQGFGAGEMRWCAGAPGRYRIAADGAEPLAAEAGPEGVLAFTLPGGGIDGVAVTVVREAGS
ncbi:MAG TPA: hypothetical protein VEH84_10065 [Alphaproteobacteria bacterium]|nr:hypothetical protein [Alphaproteobacteria bacterium]